MALFLPVLALLAAPQATQPNLVLILADDLGVDMVGAYAEGANPPCTPNIDGLAGQGMLFRRAWTNPTCSPTRAAVMTGRHGLRTGIGYPITNQESGLPLSELTLPEMLAGYESGAAGKWHLHGDLGNSHPNDTGFGSYAGSIRGAVSNYFSWPKITNGQQSNSTNYVVSETIDDAISAMGGMQEPWLLYVSLNSIHTPFHVPPSSLCPPAGSGCGAGGGFCQSLGGNPSNAELAKAMAEAMDTEIGRLMTAVNGVDPDAYVVFMGDNGTPGQASETPFTSSHAKGSMYEGGINVPLIITGPTVANAECDALVSSVDLFATFAELAGVTAGTEDSVSMVPYFTNPALALRTSVYSETFTNWSAYPALDHQQAIRGERYKLIRRYQGGVAEEFYDLDQDAFETSNLLPGLTAAQQLAYDQLDAALNALTVSDPGNYCTPGTSASGCQATLSASGTPSASASSGFVLSASSVEGNKNGLFFFGVNGRQANAWGNGTSFQCVVPPVMRAGLLGSSGTTGNCDGTFAEDLNALWCASCPSPLKNPGAGTLTQAQAWYRDPQNPSNQSTSLSDAFEFTVLP
jgi:arylsulfatase A-like enzyme